MVPFSKRLVGFLLVSLCVVDQELCAVTINTVPIGNPGNPADTEVMIDGTTGYGSVGYYFRMAKTKVTNAQYTEFLNAVAASDPYELYSTRMGTSLRGGIMRTGSFGSYTYSIKSDAVGHGPGGTDYAYAEKPVVFVSWYNAARFANWLHNGQGGGDTETGAYTILGGTPRPSNDFRIARNAGARWFLPSESEWHKSAYYDGSSGVYYDYPMGSDAVPNNNLPSADTGNSANFRTDADFTTGNSDYPLTDTGAYLLSASPYGTLDQGGNVAEWNEFEIGVFDDTTRGLRGGAWIASSELLASSFRVTSGPTFGIDFIGFRVATIPEPHALPLLVWGAVWIAYVHRRPLL